MLRDIRVLQNIMMCHTHNMPKDFDCLKLQICESNIGISISYLIVYSNSITTI